MAKRKGEEEPETCSICPASGPPKRPYAETGNDAADDVNDLQWIACSKCKTWFHSVCAALSPEFRNATIPEEVRADMDASGEGEWHDWADRVDRWYCKPCIDFSTSPENPKPPRNALHTTLKRRKRAGSGTPGSKRSRGTSPPASEEPAESSRPKRRAALERPDYYNMHNHVATPTRGWLDLIKDPAKHGREIKEDNFPRVPGKMLCKAWVESAKTGGDDGDDGAEYPTHLPPTLFYGLKREPLVVRPEDGGLASMGGMVPDPSLTVDDISRLVGPHRMVDVIDVATQQSSQWPLEQWAHYVKTRNDPTAASSSKVYNIISLEISGTDLAKSVRPPSIVSDVDWVENFWPFPGGKEAMKRAAARAAGGDDAVETLPKGKAKSEWPKVQLYCLMGMKDAWTDWHVDFAASSVYYSVHTGSKVFFFIRPTEANLAAYARWSGSHELQQSTWLPDLCDEVRKVTLTAGDTMIIPAGYIHAVFTPVDSMVFGGNFVHSYDIPTQLRIRQIEIDTKVPQRFRFPFFDRLCWYVAERYTADLRQLRAYRPSGKAVAVKRPHERILRGLVVLARFLIEQVEKLESDKTEDKLRQIIWKRIPTEVRDAGGLAHELLWRVERELPDLEDDDEEVAVSGDKGRKRKAATNGNAAKPNPKNMRLLDRPTPTRTWRFSPAPWEQADHPIQKTTTKIMFPRPDGDGTPQEAEDVTAVYRQSRMRIGRDGGETVVEEQDVVFTERRVTWPPNDTTENRPSATTGSPPPDIRWGMKMEEAGDGGDGWRL